MNSVSSPSLLSYRTESSLPLTPLQSDIDEMVGSFVHRSADWKGLLAMGAGSLAFGLGRMGCLASAFHSSGLAASLLRLGSYGAGLVNEVSAFEITNRLLNASPHAWHLRGPDGLGQRWLSSLISFGALRGFNRIGRGQNIVLRHTLTDLAMVTGHQASAALGWNSRPLGGLMDQMVMAEGMNLQFHAGMGLFHTLLPSLPAVERGLEFGMRLTEGKILTPMLQGASPSEGQAFTFPHILLMSGSDEKSTPQRDSIPGQSFVRELKPSPSPPESPEKAPESKTDEVPSFDEEEIHNILESSLPAPKESPWETDTESSDYIDAFEDPSPSSRSKTASSQGGLEDSRASPETEALQLILNPPKLPPYLKNTSPLQYQLAQLNTLLEKRMSFDQWRALGRQIIGQMGLDAFLGWAVDASGKASDPTSSLSLFRLVSSLWEQPREDSNVNDRVLLAARAIGRHQTEDPQIARIWTKTVLDELGWEDPLPADLSAAMASLEKTGFPLPIVDKLLSQAVQPNRPESFHAYRRALHLSAFAAASRHWTKTTNPLRLFFEASYLSRRLMENGDWIRAYMVNMKVKLVLETRKDPSKKALIEILEDQIAAIRPFAALLSAPSSHSALELFEIYRDSNQPASSILPPPEAVIRELRYHFPWDLPGEPPGLREAIRLLSKKTFHLLRGSLQQALPPESMKSIRSSMEQLQELTSKNLLDSRREGTPWVMKIIMDLRKTNRYDLVYRTLHTFYSLDLVDPQTVNDLILPILQDMDEILSGYRRSELLEEAATIDQAMETLGLDMFELQATFLKRKRTIEQTLSRLEDPQFREGLQETKILFTRWMEELF